VNRRTTSLRVVLVFRVVEVDHRPVGRLAQVRA
jgi:hypothetical protein